MTPFVLGVLIIATILVFILPKKRIVVPFLLSILTIPFSQSIVVGGLHFYASRLVILAALMRMATSGASWRSALAGGYNLADSAFVWCMVCQAVATTILFASGSSLVYELGFILDFVGPYIVLRWLIAEEPDINRVLSCLAVLAAILAVTMVVEQIKLVNVFYFIGGGRLTPEVREGKIRSQGVFMHSLLAGCFAATLIPLFLLLWRNGKRMFSIVGLVGATIMTVTANSSTPLLAYVGGIAAICLWPIRRSMRGVRIGLSSAIIGLHLVMKAPVWFLIARVDLTGGSSGYHRAELIDGFIRHFSDWWLLGVKDTSSWGLDLWDAQNQFVNIGETGGLLAFILFIVLLKRLFANVGKSRRSVEGNRSPEWSFWLLGSALVSHIVAFFGVNYFDQSRLGLFVLFSIIAAMTARVPSDQSRIGTAAGMERLDQSVESYASAGRGGEWLVTPAEPSEWLV